MYAETNRKPEQPENPMGFSNLGAELEFLTSAANSGLYGPISRANFPKTFDLDPGFLVMCRSKAIAKRLGDLALVQSKIPPLAPTLAGLMDELIKEAEDLIPYLITPGSQPGQPRFFADQGDLQRLNYIKEEGFDAQINLRNFPFLASLSPAEFDVLIEEARSKYRAKYAGIVATQPKTISDGVPFSTPLINPEYQRVKQKSQQP